MMQISSRSMVLAAIAAVLAGFSPAARATGVTAGSSSLIGTYDYTDTFTGGTANRPFVPALQPAAAYAIENTYGHPTANFQTAGKAAGIADFSFASDGPGTPGLVDGSPAYPGTSGAGSDTGFTQTGNNVDYTAPYGFRSQYVVQLDAVLGSDRIDIISGPSAGTIGGGNLSIFFRASGGADLYNGTTDTPIPGFASGLTNDGKWHNFAVRFDQTANQIELYVDQASKGTVDLQTFAGSIYANFSNANVGGGEGLGGGQNRVWTDNFQVGSIVVTPEPTAIALIGLAGIGAFRRQRG